MFIKNSFNRYDCGGGGGGGGESTRLWRHVNSLTLYMYWLTVLFVDEDRLIKYPIC